MENEKPQRKLVRLNPNGPEPISVLEGALDDVGDYEEVIVIGFTPTGERAMYASKGVGAMLLSWGSVILQDLAIDAMKGNLVPEWKPPTTG
jgi:hypothetical protein